jgi:hypothetical protein
MIAEKEISRSVLARLETADLEMLQAVYRKLQQPYEQIFWKLEEFLGRIDDELERRSA